MRIKGRSWLTPVAWSIYVVVVLEFLFMISPFALYFYSAYGPALNFLHRSPASAWLTGFFLPHFSHTHSWVLNELHAGGETIGMVGLLLFAVGAVQIYGGKRRSGGAVMRGL